MESVLVPGSNASHVSCRRNIFSLAQTQNAHHSGIFLFSFGFSALGLSGFGSVRAYASRGCRVFNSIFARRIMSDSVRVPYQRQKTLSAFFARNEPRTL